MLKCPRYLSFETSEFTLEHMWSKYHISHSMEKDEFRQIHNSISSVQQSFHYITFVSLVQNNYKMTTYAVLFVCLSPPLCFSLIFYSNECGMQQLKGWTKIRSDWVRSPVRDWGQSPSFINLRNFLSHIFKLTKQIPMLQCCGIK